VQWEIRIQIILNRGVPRLAVKDFFEMLDAWGWIRTTPGGMVFKKVDPKNSSVLSLEFFMNRESEGEEDGDADEERDLANH
jgi:hypothetical protein